jgi:PAS domain S-box-containing protein
MPARPYGDGTASDMPAMSPESREREAAYRRGEEIARRRARGELDGQSGLAAQFAPSCASLVDNVREYAMFIMDSDAIIRLWGESARLMKWFTREQAEGAHLRMLYPDGGSDDGTAEAHVEAAVEKGEYTGEGQRIRSDGSTFWARVTLTALKDEHGKLHGFAKVVRDFTAQHAAESKVTAALESSATAQKRAEESSRAKTLFIATVSHEIRNPVNAILGYLRLLDQPAAPLTDTHRVHLERIRTVSNHLLSVVDDVIDSARLEAGRLTVAGSHARLGKAIEDALIVAAPQAAAKGVALLNSVPGYGADVAYYGDEQRVRQILVNLLNNAVKFTPGGGTVKISAGTAESPSPDAKLEGAPPWAYVRVEDTGPGIPPDQIRLIFEPFERAGSTDPGGAGLGLSISRRLARLMGGDLTARSQLGNGATFFLWLPAASGATPAADEA